MARLRILEETEVLRDDILPEQPVADGEGAIEESDAGKTGGRGGLWLALAAVVVVLIGLAFAAPSLFGRKPPPPPAAAPAAMAAPQAVPLPNGVEAPAAESAIADPLAEPVDPLAATEADKPVMKAKRKTAPKKVEDVPY